MAWKKLLVASTAIGSLMIGTAAEARWITTWSTAPVPPTVGAGNGRVPATPSFSNRTVRQVLRVSAGGKALRLRLTNAYGQAPLSIGAAAIVELDGAGREKPGTRRKLSFSGKPTATVPKGGPLVSDAVPLALAPLSRIAISFYLPSETGPCTCHPFGYDDVTVSAPGDFTSGEFKAESTTMSRPYLAAVEVDAADNARTVVALGDSITDGIGSTAGANRRWPDILAERLAARRGSAAWGVANQGITGNSLLRDGMGESALARLDRDVFSLAGVAAVIVFEGVNDLGGIRASASGNKPDPEVEAARLIAAYRQIIVRGRGVGIKVYGATIAPYKGAGYWSAEGELTRQAVNAFIRTSGEFDGVLDFDAALRDPADPAKMRDSYHMGDFLHGSDAGYNAIGNAIDLRLFAR